MAKIKFEWLSPEQKREKSLGIVKKFQKEINSLQNKIMKVDRTAETIKIYFSVLKYLSPISKALIIST